MDGDAARIYLIRHGEVVDSIPKKYNGQRDIPLSEAGLQQMRTMAGRLAGHPIRAIYCSDLIRTRRGAEILARSGTVPVYARPALREKNFGAWEGLTYDEVAGRFPDAWAAWLRDPASARPQGGETYLEVADRVLKELSAILERHRKQEVVVLAHGGVNRVILCHALQIDLRHIFRIEQKFAALNIIDFYCDGTARVHLMNG